jgi:hypothetical protein
VAYALIYTRMTLSLLAGIDTHGDDGELESDRRRSEALVAVAKKCVSMPSISTGKLIWLGFSRYHNHGGATPG